jgi:hypothetical protein
LFLEDWGDHGIVPKFHWNLSTYLKALQRAGLHLKQIGELAASDDVTKVQNHAISFKGHYPSLAVFVCAK